MKKFNKIYNNILPKTTNLIHEGNGKNINIGKRQKLNSSQPQQPQQTSQQQNINQPQPQQQQQINQNQQTSQQPQPPSQQSVNQLSDDQMEQMEQELKNMLLSSSEYKDLLIGIEAYIKKGESSL